MAKPNIRGGQMSSYPPLKSDWLILLKYRGLLGSGDIPWRTTAYVHTAQSLLRGGYGSSSTHETCMKESAVLANWLMVRRWVTSREYVTCWSLASLNGWVDRMWLLLALLESPSSVRDRWASEYSDELVISASLTVSKVSVKYSFREVGNSKHMWLPWT
jgi:hypothetical protein